MDKFQNKYRIPTARAQWHGYDGGIYFVTICTAERLHLFGEITDSQMLLSDVGRIAYDNFANVTVHYPYAEIPLFTVMPNHIHAIVVIDGNKGNGRDAINRVSATTNNLFRIVNQLKIQGSERRIPDGIVYVNGLPVVVLEFKSAVKEDTTIMDAYTQLTMRYRRDIPDLFRYNAFVVISDGVNNKYGSLFSPYDFFYAWRKWKTVTNCASI